ncbi:CDP-2,3-bis-(O-geranylgeranyl)-sn-glycerol synthase [Halovenus aranensis]|uniref:CDP-archaeol synthase n=1 Tax=Halovenus aranensis TaxID=890420 RepID=A0A1G8UP74_9EURY|nr:CDP-2,3-bis-(O-geranylgeranyl)-sn-glycerol synthase [Halovenus aranensis]SDJ55454.1 CDP-2,3-bis-(O-geranylgeranyl)-sn-glycerol synthase [Halovenus aranensis]
MELFGVVVTAFWAMLPAYIPNNAAVLAGGGRPIDGGRTMGDSRLLGDGKTWRGTLVGWLAGAALAVGLNALEPGVSDAVGIALPTFPLAIALALPLGAMLGDIGASFLKRRSGRERGAPFPGVDQLDFVVGSLLLASIADFAASLSWFADTFTAPVLAVVLLMTPMLHVSTNALAYAVGLKDEPW